MLQCFPREEWGGGDLNPAKNASEKNFFEVWKEEKAREIELSEDKVETIKNIMSNFRKPIHVYVVYHVTIYTWVIEKLLAYCNIPRSTHWREFPYLKIRSIILTIFPLLSFFSSIFSIFFLVLIYIFVNSFGSQKTTGIFR